MRFDRRLNFWNYFYAAERNGFSHLFHSVFKHHLLAFIYFQQFIRCVHRASSQRSKVYMGHHIRGKYRFAVIRHLDLRKSLIMLSIYLKSVSKVENTDHINLTFPFQYCSASFFNKLSERQTDQYPKLYGRKMLRTAQGSMLLSCASCPKNILI